MRAERPISCDILEAAQMFKETVEFAISPTPLKQATQKHKLKDTGRVSLPPLLTDLENLKELISILLLKKKRTTKKTPHDYHDG